MKHDEFPSGMKFQGCLFWLAAFAACAVYEFILWLHRPFAEKWPAMHLRGTKPSSRGSR